MPVISRSLQAALFIASGCLHLAIPDTFVRIVPPWIPNPAAMVLVSGIAEMVGGVGLLNHKTRQAATWGLIALLAAVFPANIHMAVVNVQPKNFEIPQALFWARLPLQPVLAWWLYSVNKKMAAERAAAPQDSQT